MLYSVRFETRTTLDDDQIDDLVRRARGVLATTSPDTGESRFLELILHTDDPTSDWASRNSRRRFKAAVEAMPTGTVEDPFRIVVQLVDAPTGRAIVSTVGVAEMLDVSDARVRQLAQRPDFPKPLTIPGLAGSVYERSAIRAWASTWDRDAKGGRPRKADD